jgi:hypothetical protein
LLWWYEMVNIKDVKINIATAIAAAFGFVIALLWRDIIIGLLKMTPFWNEEGFSDPAGAAVAIVLVLVVTIICVIGIMYITKWGGIEKK